MAASPRGWPGPVWLPSSSVPTLDRFLRYDELTTELHALAAASPDLIELSSIGRSHEGREIWLATVTDTSTGPHHDKPAHWVDANIHAVELTGSVAALHLIDRLVSAHGVDERVTRALRTRTFYVVPRLNPDGADLVLADRPRFLRSSVRRWPWRDGHDAPGLREEDVDGDGRLLTMRLPDPDGGVAPASGRAPPAGAAPARRRRAATAASGSWRRARWWITTASRWRRRARPRAST